MLLSLVSCCIVLFEDVVELDLLADGFGQFANSNGVEGTIGDDVIGLLEDMLGIEFEDNLAEVLEFSSGSLGIDNDSVVLLLSVELDSIALLFPFGNESEGCLNKRVADAGGFEEDNVGVGIGEPEFELDCGALMEGNGTGD